MITSQNIGKLLENIKYSKKTESLFFNINRSVIKKITKNDEYNFSIIKNNIETNFKINLLKMDDWECSMLKNNQYSLLF